ncbi:transposase, partial [Brachybacterium paraconglomeratum]|uniref:transposase n=1 Tax=Brachybacterium paraconglomeratum TaxID=173362 RepID=UPI0037CB3BD5
MARKNYSEEFRQQAVDLYESTPGATLRGIAEDLGIVRGTLRQWLETHGSGKKTGACQMVCVSRTERNGKNHDHDRREDAGWALGP